MATTVPSPSGEVGALREHFERYRGVTLQILDLIPDDKLAWRPLDGQRSFAEQLLHIAQVHEFYLLGLFLNDWNFDRVKPVAQPLNRAELREKLTAVGKLASEHLASLDPARLDAVMTVPNVPVPWTLRDWLWYVVQHEVHHKAQLALYLRKIGVVPPFFAYVFQGGFRPDIR